MIITIYSDYHLLIPMALPNDLPKTYDDVLAQNAYYLGDNIDYAGCGDIFEATKLISLYRNIFKERFISGNHERLISNLHLKINNILLCHGDIPIIGLEKALKRRSKTTVTRFGWLQSSFAWLRKKIDYKLSKTKLKRLSAYAKIHNCNSIIFGHTHTNKLIVTKFNDVTIINVPRGKTILNLEGILK